MPSYLDYILFNKVKEPFGWLGNMSPYAIKFGERRYPTAEHLFQIGRLGFNHPDIDELIKIKSPMALKMKVKSMKDQFIYEPLGEKDLYVMEQTINLKFLQHDNLRAMLKDTDDMILVENVFFRKTKGAALFWGGYLDDDANLIGKNMLGNILMKTRKHL